MGMIIINGEEYASAPKNGFPPLVYSDEEREIGVWRDGKPLYQKTCISNSGESISINGLEIKQALCYAKYGTDGIIQVPYNDGGYVVYWIENENIYFAENKSPSYSYIITIQYTKTTDTPGSGKWSPSGLPAHHYSTTEKVIGTWIDGKPLYEKTTELSSMVEIRPAGVVVSDVDITDIDNIISCIGVYQNNKQCVPATAWVYNGSFYMSSSVSAGIDCVIIQYTKTTD